MTTDLRFDKVFNGNLWFRCDGDKLFNVKSLNEGVMVIEPEAGSDVYDFAEYVADCFEKDSSFYGLKAIEFELNGAYVSVNSENADYYKIFQMWGKKCIENAMNLKKEHDECRRSLEYRINLAKNLRIKHRNSVVKKMAQDVMRTEELEFKNEEARELLEDCTIFNPNVAFYAVRWAKFMQYLMSKHEGVTVEQIAYNASKAAISGVTTYTYSDAAELIINIWKYGEEFQQWINKKCRLNEDELIKPVVPDVRMCVSVLTNLRFEQVFDGSLCFRCEDGQVLCVKSLNDGVMVITPIIGCNIASLAKNVAGCFNEKSEFYGLKAIKFELGGVHVLVNESNANPDRISQIWEKKIRRNDLDVNEVCEDYDKISKYSSKMTQRLKLQYRNLIVRKKVFEAIENEEFQLKNKVDDKGFKSCFRYRNDACRYAMFWAKFMQYLMSKHKGVTVEQIAQNTSKVSNIENVGTINYEVAVTVLMRYWKYGDEFRKWFIKKYR